DDVQVVLVERGSDRALWLVQQLTNPGHQPPLADRPTGVRADVLVRVQRGLEPEHPHGGRTDVDHEPASLGNLLAATDGMAYRGSRRHSGHRTSLLGGA